MVSTGKFWMPTAAAHLPSSLKKRLEKTPGCPNRFLTNTGGIRASHSIMPRQVRFFSPIRGTGKIAILNSCDTNGMRPGERTSRQSPRDIASCRTRTVTAGTTVEPEHLDAYLDEFVFRFNRRTSSLRRLSLSPLTTISPVPYVDRSQSLSPRDNKSAVCAGESA